MIKRLLEALGATAVVFVLVAVCTPSAVADAAPIPTCARTS